MRPRATRKRTAYQYARDISREIWQHPANRDHRVRALARGWGWQVRKRLVPRPVDIDYEGYRLRCHPDSQSASNVWYFTARYDPDEMDLLDRLLRPGDRFLDIGANIGTYTLFAARRTAPDGEVVAFECDPVNVERFRENVARNGLRSRVELVDAAVAAAEGEMAFTDAYDVSNSVISDEFLDRYTHHPVRTVALDDVLAPGPDLVVAKLDVEGAEVLALQGARRLLATASPPVWITEVYDHQLRKLGSSAAELLAVFDEAGFDPCLWSAAGRRLVPSASTEGGNLVFVARARRSEVERRLS